MKGMIFFCEYLSLKRIFSYETVSGQIYASFAVLFVKYFFSFLDDFCFLYFRVGYTVP